MVPDELVPALSALALSASEHEVLLRHLQGQTAHEMAADLGIAPTAAKCHLRAIHRALGVTDRDGVVRWWLTLMAGGVA